MFNCRYRANRDEKEIWSEREHSSFRARVRAYVCMWERERESKWAITIIPNASNASRLNIVHLYYLYELCLVVAFVHFRLCAFHTSILLWFVNYGIYYMNYVETSSLHAHIHNRHVQLVKYGYMEYDSCYIVSIADVCMWHDLMPLNIHNKWLVGCYRKSQRWKAPECLMLELVTNVDPFANNSELFMILLPFNSSTHNTNCVFTAQYQHQLLLIRCSAFSQVKI